MRVLSRLHDSRIDSDNYLVELPIKEYLDLVHDVLEQNEFQRRRVASSKSIYSLLKQDIQRGCVIPPIVLALTSINKETELTIETLSDYVTENRKNLVILDGLQRTYSLVDLEDELNIHGNEQGNENLSKHLLRVEIYVGINRLGILYRMLTLNTGQTPMSLRQQIEMLYLDYAKVPLDGVTFIREVDDKAVSAPNEYNFREIIEGFNSYLERNELPIERADLLENIKSLEKLSQENAASDIFKEYVEAWHAFVLRITDLTQGAILSFDEKSNMVPWGKTTLQIFKKAQAVSGFGAAVGRLKDFGLINGFDSIKTSVGNLQAIDDPQAFLQEFNTCIFWINNNSKKIGNAQRVYFQYYFRELFNPQSDHFCRPQASIGSAFQKYLSQNT